MDFDITDDKYAELFGFILGDGSCCPRQVVVYAKLYELEVVKELMSRLPGRTLVYEKKLQKGRTEVLYQLMNCKLSVAQEMARNFRPKSIPDWMKAKSLEYRVRVVRGLMEAEGDMECMGKTSFRVKFVSTNVGLIDFVACVFRECCVNASRRIANHSGVDSRGFNRKDAWQVRTRVDGGKVFKEKIGFLTDKKNERLRDRLVLRMRSRRSLAYPDLLPIKYGEFNL